MAEAIPDGVFFGMDEAQYHAAPALSQSSMKWLLVSPMDFWARSWMNPDREEESSDAMEIGKAYHTRILEGRDRFYSLYAEGVYPNEHPDALRTADDLRDALKARGLKTTGNKPQLIERLMEADPAVEVWDRLVEENRERNQGKTLLSWDLIRRIELAAAMIEKHHHLCKAFTGGVPEVSVFWHDDEYGVPLKARIDYLKVAAIVDLKSFANKLNKPIDKAVVQAMSAQRYHMQAAHYDAAVERAREFVAEGRVFGEAPDWLEDFAKIDMHSRRFLFVFQQTGVAPVARGYVMPRNSVYEVGRMAVREAIRQFDECWRTYGTDPWVDTADITEFEDESFPVWAMEV